MNCENKHLQCVLFKWLLVLHFYLDSLTPSTEVSSMDLIIKIAVLQFLNFAKVITDTRCGDRSYNRDTGLFQECVMINVNKSLEKPLPMTDLR